MSNPIKSLNEGVEKIVDLKLSENKKNRKKIMIIITLRTVEIKNLKEIEMEVFMPKGRIKIVE